MRKAALVLFASLLCVGAAPDNEHVSFRVGRWVSNMNIAEIDAPRLPQEARDRLRQTLEAGNGRSQCVGGTTTDLIRDMRSGLIQGFTGRASGGDCTFSPDDHYGDGRVRLVATCQLPDGAAEVVMRLEGTYDAGRIDVDMDMAAGAVGAAQRQPVIHVRGSMNMRWSGPCTPAGGT